jgi:hypothetical protein
LRLTWFGRDTKPGGNASFVAKWCENIPVVDAIAQARGFQSGAKPSHAIRRPDGQEMPDSNGPRSTIQERGAAAQPTTTRGQIQTISFPQIKFVVSPSVFSARVSKNRFATPFRFSSFPPRRHSPCCARVSRPRPRSDRRSQLRPLSHSAKLFSNHPLAFGRQIYYCSLPENDRPGLPPRSRRPTGRRPELACTEQVEDVEGHSTGPLGAANYPAGEVVEKATLAAASQLSARTRECVRRGAEAAARPPIRRLNGPIIFLFTRPESPRRSGFPA